MKMFKTNSWSIDIYTINVKKATPKSVWVCSKNGDVSLCRRLGEHFQYHDTFNEAKEFLLKRENEFLKKHSENLESIQKLEEPNDLQKYPLQYMYSIK